MEHSERLWLTRLRWRMRGAWLWPAFFGLTAVDGALIALLPPYDGAPRDAIGGVLLAGFANLAAIAVLGDMSWTAKRVAADQKALSRMKPEAALCPVLRPIQVSAPTDTWGGLTQSFRWSGRSSPRRVGCD